MGPVSIALPLAHTAWFLPFRDYAIAEQPVQISNAAFLLWLQVHSRARGEL